MIVYELKCSNDHQFESWFKNIDFFESQKKNKLIDCPLCGSRDIDIVFTPLRIIQKENISKKPGEKPGEKPVNCTSDPKAESVRKALQELQKAIAKNCDYVGNQFAEVARQIHYGEKKIERGIYGETTPDEAQSLQEEGIGFVTLPITKTNS